ncbi:GNAT family N-acetyltransferase [Cognatishimia maritima]|uniref:Acetyltransferase (GNAT) family protein n=1 Tax=Cognatishimia maritima TaxID=870908 RepID=A0A1M5NND9_9RHOB|nr:GNAT family N-acetyltransferase [Cognatishimia maritima]SHG91094.1 Acetyltransferase (GNAT) family protein [Cognatishimia maritima]
MSLPDIKTLYSVCEATWPPAARSSAGGFTIRDGKQGGKRVSAATLADTLAQIDLFDAEHAMAALNQPSLFQIREGEDALDALLETEGYAVVDPVNVWAATTETLMTELPPRTVAIPAWEPLQIMKEIWAEGGIGTARIEVMHRVKGPKTGFLSRWNDKPAGAAFAAMHRGMTMVHAVEIKPEFRRNGLGRWAMRRAAYWTHENQGHTVSVICTQDNVAANALYQGLGMTRIGSYHYRIKP